MDWHMKICPKASRICFLQPQPSHPKSPAKALEVGNCKTTKLFGEAHFGPCHYTMATFGLFLPLTKKPLLNLSIALMAQGIALIAQGGRSMAIAI
jgi:hypothetical protein